MTGTQSEGDVVIVQEAFWMLRAMWITFSSTPAGNGDVHNSRIHDKFHPRPHLIRHRRDLTWVSPEQGATRKQCGSLVEGNFKR